MDGDSQPAAAIESMTNKNKIDASVETWRH